MIVAPEIVHILPTQGHLFGATLAQEHREHAIRENGGGTRPLLLVFDFQNAISVSGSYLRSTIQWSIVAGAAHARGETGVSAESHSGISPLPVYPAVVNVSGEVLDEVQDFLATRRLPLLLLTSPWSQKPVAARLLGTLDSFLASTLLRLVELGPWVTAAELARSNSENITTNAWSNRLFDLLALRLVYREREGRFWKYSSISEKITLWD